MDPVESHAIIKELLELTLEGRVTAQDFESRWPFSDSPEEPYKTIYDDVQEAITHTPGLFLKRGVDMKIWKGMYERHVILCDYLLFPKLTESPQGWLATREKVVASTWKSNLLDEDAVAEFIKQAK